MLQKTSDSLVAVTPPTLSSNGVKITLFRLSHHQVMKLSDNVNAPNTVATLLTLHLDVRHCVFLILIVVLIDLQQFFHYLFLLLRSTD